MENIAIIGSGPAGLTAGIYAARAGLKPVVLEGVESGGQLMQTQHVANYPGFPETVAGAAIIAAIRSQAEKAGARFVMDVVERVDFTGPVKRLFTMMGDVIEAKAVVVASGAGATKTGLPGEAKYWGHGISACLTCDGAFYAGKKVTVVGEGPAAAGARNYLARCGAEVVAVVAPQEVASFDGDGARLTGVTRKAGEPIACDGLFLVTARTPQTQFLGDALARDERGHIVVEGAKTSVPGVFAAGDCARPRHKQAVVAAGDGAVAALEAAAFLSGFKDGK
ncbi:MAG: NAD(P)/FAD-dependent oxidoreductase [Kiritimatiellia bacterium]